MGILFKGISANPDFTRTWKMAHTAKTVTKEQIINGWIETEGIPQLVGIMEKNESFSHNTKGEEIKRGYGQSGWVRLTTSKRHPINHLSTQDVKGYKYGDVT
eukprot:gene22025-8623_t